MALHNGAAPSAPPRPSPVWPHDPPPPAPTSKHTNNKLINFDNFNPYHAPQEIRRPIQRRPQSVVAPRPIADTARRPHSVGFEDDWPSTLLHPIPRRPRPVSNQNGFISGLSLNLNSSNQTLPRPCFTNGYSGYNGYSKVNGIPSSRSDYQLQRPAILSNGYGAVPPSTSRRLSLPGASQGSPKPSATVHGLAALLAGLEQDGGHEWGHHGVTPTTPCTPTAVREAVRHLLQQPRNGFPIMDHKLSLFIEILDAQERFSQVGFTCSYVGRNLLA